MQSTKGKRTYLESMYCIEAREGNLYEMITLLEAGVCINANSGMALTSAIMRGHLHVVEFLFNKGAAFDSGTIVSASMSNELGMLNFLLSRVQYDAIALGDALMEAACEGNLKIVKRLFQEEVPFDNKTLSSALKESLFKCNFHVSEFLIMKGATLTDFASLSEDAQTFMKCSEQKMAILAKVGRSLNTASRCYLGISL